MPKERSINPAQAARKADKVKALKKSKLEKHSRQNEKLARRNPERLQRQIDDLKELESSGQIRPKDKETLEQLEKDLKGVKRAREALGDRAPVYNQSRRSDHGDHGKDDANSKNLGKRRRDEPHAYGRGYKQDPPESETDDEVRDIPMPRDTPPPIPRRGRDNRNNGPNASTTRGDNDNSNNSGNTPAQPPAPTKTVYSSAPVLRNLTQESRRFVPAAVAQNLARQKGEGGRLLEPEELDKLEKAGYGDAAHVADEATKEATYMMMNAVAEQGGDFDIDKEAKMFERELKAVEMEEVPDEDL